jgi:hypothetical protein
MQVVKWDGAEAVVRVETRTDVIVAIPDALPPHEVLDLAGLVLSGREYHELRRRIQPRRAVSRGYVGPRPPKSAPTE